MKSPKILYHEIIVFLIIIIDLFNLYSENIIRNIDEIKGIVIRGHNLNNLRYADDIVLIASSREKLQEMLDKIIRYSEEKGLSINLQKIECMTVSKRESAPAYSIEIANKPVKQVESFIYLGT